MKRTPALSVLLALSAALLPSSLLHLGCAGSPEPVAEPRYPEKRRPPPLRSASDGEVLGADGIAPEDRLEASPTNQHPAKGWVVEDGKLMPEKEAHHREEAHRRSGYETQPAAPGNADPDCEPVNAAGQPGAATPAAPATSGSTGSGRKRKPCPPPAKP
jgi:hypothetical protein